jgi:predicted dinucleotide-binding enzyme
MTDDSTGLADKFLSGAHDALCAAAADLTRAMFLLDATGAQDVVVLANAVEREAEAVAAVRERLGGSSETR